MRDESCDGVAKRFGNALCDNSPPNVQFVDCTDDISFDTVTVHRLGTSEAVGPGFWRLIVNKGHGMGKSLNVKLKSIIA